VTRVSFDLTIRRYLRDIRNFPFITADEEIQLFKNWRDDGDLDAAHRIVTSHLRLVVKIAMDYRGYGLPLAELISEGNIGMMRALKRYDPGRGFRFATYAAWWIRAAMQEHALHSWSLVKMGTTAAQKKLFFGLRRLRSQLQAIDEGDLSPENVERIAAELGVPEADVVSMDRRLAIPDFSLNAPLQNDAEGEWQDWLVDEKSGQEADLGEQEELGLRRRLLQRAMGLLTERQRSILIARRLTEQPATLESLSRHYGVSPERVRQIELHAFDKVRSAVRRSSTLHEPAAEMATEAGI
jgi:RNA polymerase sigma-32 factor